jgi:hypothetical protein
METDFLVWPQCVITMECNVFHVYGTERQYLRVKWQWKVQNCNSRVIRIVNTVLPVYRWHETISTQDGISSLTAKKLFELLKSNLSVNFCSKCIIHRYLKDAYQKIIRISSLKVLSKNDIKFAIFWGLHFIRLNCPAL